MFSSMQIKHMMASISAVSAVLNLKYVIHVTLKTVCNRGGVFLYLCRDLKLERARPVWRSEIVTTQRLYSKLVRILETEGAISVWVEIV